MNAPGVGRPERWKRRWFAVAAVALGVLVVLGGLEAGLRVYHTARGTFRLDEEARRARAGSVWTRSDDPVLIYVHRPGYEKDGRRWTESHGLLRPHDVSRPKPAGTLRVLLLGDSIGAALDLAYEDRFASILERALADSLGLPVEVLNFSVNGYRTIQEARLLETAAAGFDPDLILVAYCMNDVANSLTPTKWFLDPSPPRSHLWDLVSSRLGVGNRPLPPVPVFGPDYAHGPYKYWHQLYDPRSEGWASVLEGFDRIAWVASREKAPVLVVIFPFFLSAGWYAGGVEPLHRQVEAAAGQRGFAVLDLLPVFAHRSVDEVRDDPEDIFHPNARGHRIAAEAMLGPVASCLGNAPGLRPGADSP